MSAESAGCEALRAGQPAMHPQRVVAGAKRPATTLLISRAAFLRRLNVTAQKVRVVLSITLSPIDTA